MNTKDIKELKKLVKELEKLGKPSRKIHTVNLEEIANDEAFKMMAVLMEKHNYDANAAFDDAYRTCKQLMEESQEDLNKHVEKGFKEAKYKKGEQDYLKTNAKLNANMDPVVIFPLKMVKSLLHHTKVTDAKGLVLHALEEIYSYIKEKEL